MKQAFFGRPSRTFVRGGTHISVYLVPVFEGRLVVFDVAAEDAAGRWLPWDVLPWRGNPYAAASELADNWCDGALADLRLVDALSQDLPGDGWELSLVFRAVLTALPQGDDHRSPSLLEPGAATVQPFETIDIERWVGTPAIPQSAPGPGARDLIF